MNDYSEELVKTKAQLNKIRGLLIASNRREKTTVEYMNYYLSNNEENGVVYMPKFIVEKIANQYHTKRTKEATQCTTN